MYYTRIFIITLLITFLTACTSTKFIHRDPVVLKEPVNLDISTLNECVKPKTLSEDLEIINMQEYGKLDRSTKSKKIFKALSVNKLNHIDCYKAILNFKAMLKEHGVYETSRIQ